MVHFDLSSLGILPSVMNMTTKGNVISELVKL